MDLYSRVKKNQYKDKINKTKDDYEFEKMQEHLKFAPKIKAVEEIEQSEIEVSQVKGMDKIMDRMQKAR
jgi:hypothetical protein